MAVHHFTAPDLIVVRGWQPIDTFPHDGRTVEVRDAMGQITKAAWNNKTGQIEVSAGAGVSVEWRNPD
jgi:hypothetical protein